MQPFFNRVFTNFFDLLCFGYLTFVNTQLGPKKHRLQFHTIINAYVILNFTIFPITTLGPMLHFDQLKYFHLFYNFRMKNSQIFTFFEILNFYAHKKSCE